MALKEASIGAASELNNQEQSPSFLLSEYQAVTYCIQEFESKVESSVLFDRVFSRIYKSSLPIQADKFGCMKIIGTSFLI